MEDFELFKQELEACFGQVDAVEDALHEFETLKQTSSCTALVSCYYELFPYLSLTDQTKIACFKHAIKADVLDKMIGVWP
jgi:hypothetical protein